ncbi:MAG: RNA polymerase sigma factor [Bacteroidales bacterium]
MKNKLYRFALRLLRNVQESEDIVQEVFIRLWARKDNIKEYRSIEAFAMTMTKNLCLDKLKSKAHSTIQLTIKHEEADEMTPFIEVERNDAYDRVKKLIDQLPEQQRMIIHLRDIEGYEYNEIADVMGISENTIRVNLSRARKKVRDMMIKKYNYEFTKN